MVHLLAAQRTGQLCGPRRERVGYREPVESGQPEQLDQAPLRPHRDQHGVALDEVATQLVAARGRPVVDADGAVLGTVGQLYTDYRGRAQWLAIKSGPIGSEERLVPAAGIDLSEGVRVAVTAAEVRRAGDLSLGPILDASQVKDLRRHYGVEAPPGQI